MNGTHKALRPIDDGSLHHESHVPVANDVSATHETGLEHVSADRVDSKDETQICAKSKSSPHPDPLSGRIIGGRFEVREALGDGGLGRLLSAYDRRAERALSLRVVRCADVASRLGARVAEVAGLAHPGLLPVIGVLRSPATVSSAAHEVEGSAMIVQGALDGQSVASQLVANRLRGEHAQPEQAYRIVAEVAAALDAAHESGPHGAVGPETVWIDHQGKAVLSDLVLSRVVLSHDCREGEGRAARHTLFLSPEVKRGATPERASDVYGLSALFYSLLTGQLPNEQVDPSSSQAELTRAFDEVLRRGLALHPADRYPTPDALCAALLESVRDAEQQAKSTAARNVQCDAPASEATQPSAAPVSEAVELAPFKPSSPRSKVNPDKFSVTLLLNVPANRAEPREALPVLSQPVVADSKVKKAKPAQAFPKVSVAAAKPEVARPARPVLERPPLSRTKRAPLAQTPAVSSVPRDGISAKLALVKAKTQVDCATPALPPVPQLATLHTAPISERPAREQKVVALAPPVSLPPPVPVSPVVNAPSLPAVAEPSINAVDAPSLPAVAEPSMTAVDATPLAATDTLSLAAMDTLLIPAVAVVTERPRMASLRTWMTSVVPRDAFGWLPSQAAVLDTLRGGGRALVAASALVTRWAADVAASQAFRRLDRPMQLLLGSSLVFVLSLIGLLLARGPAGHGQALLRARDEVAAVERHFDPRQAERNLAEQAREEGRVSLVVEVPVLSKHRRLTTESQTLSVAPLSEVKLETLAQMEAHALPGSTVTVYAPDVEALASSLGFRLRRRATLDTITVEQVALFWADVSQQDADLELLVATLRERRIEAKRALSGSRRAVDRLSLARLNRAPAKGSFTQGTTRRAPASARAGRLLRERRKASQEAQASYEEAAQRAERYSLKPSAAPGPAEVAAARVTVRFGSATETFDVPVRVHPAQVSIAPPVGVGFGATHAAGAWDTIKDKTPKAAVVTLASLLPWQTHAIGLMTALTCLFFGLICVLSYRMLHPETRRAWALHLHSVAAAAYERLRALVAQLRSR